MSSGNSSGSSSDTAARKREEYNLSLRFMNALQRKMEQIQMRQRAGDSSLTGILELGEAERKKLLEINNRGVLEGTVAGVLSFFLLRRIRAGFLRRMLRQQEAHPTTGAPPPTMGTPGGTPVVPHAPKSPFQQQKPPTGSASSSPPPSAGAEIPSPQRVATAYKESRTSGMSGAFFNFLGFAIDATVSFYIAVFVSIRNPGKIMNELAKIPLIEGRSRVSDEFCPEFLHELKEMQKDVLENNDAMQADALKNPESVALKGLLEFCHNCKQRAAYEKQLRQQLGLSDSDPVSIPPPGVPVTATSDPALSPNFAYDDSDSSDNNQGFYDAGENNNSNNFYDPSREEKDQWADPFVTDQEEQAKRDRERRSK